MNGLLQHLKVSLRLHFRNRMALLYGYLFPLAFLIAFWVLYRHDKIPLLRHMGELLTISILGGTCFGLPTTLVSERECGVWRRYRLTPIPVWALVTSTVLARYVLLLSAGVLQLGVALAVGMTFPASAMGLFVSFTATAFAFIGLGLVIAMLANSVPAVQALGQCIFLPMLIIGGVVVQVESLPSWAQHVSAFFPGRYAVEALQASVAGAGQMSTGFNLLALTVIGTAACFAGAKLFRWDMQPRHAGRTGKLWLVPVLGAWCAVGLLAEWRGRVIVMPSESSVLVQPKTPAAKRALENWTAVTAKDVASLNFNVPSDFGVVTPFASADDEPEDFIRGQMATIRENLPVWPPANEGGLVQRVRACLAACAIADVVQAPVEAYLPRIVLDYLENSHPKRVLIQLLTWIALNPEEGRVVDDITELGVEGAVENPDAVRERTQLYAIKFIARLTGRIPR